MRSLNMSLMLAALVCGQAAVASSPVSIVFAQATPAPAATLPTLSSVHGALDGIVNITTAPLAGVPDGSSRGWSPFPNTLLTWLGTGSGVLLNASGEVLTSARLVSGHEFVTLTFRSGHAVRARVVGTRPDRDVALLRVEGAVPAGARPVRLAPSGTLRTGQRLVALGLSSNGGFDAQEVTVRSVDPRAEILLEAPLRAETRGGPLVNARGEVVALVTGRFGTRLPDLFVTGVGGAAVPVGVITPLLDEIRAAGKPTTSATNPSISAAQVPGSAQPVRLGVSIVDLRTIGVRFLREWNLPTAGVLIQDVAAGSAAERAGLRGGSAVRHAGAREVRVGGDVIVSVDGRPVRDARELQEFIRSRQAGSTVRLEVWRDGHTQAVTVTLAQ